MANETKDAESRTTATKSGDFDYIIVGSGAGGGPLAARLAQAGKRVLVIEAGGNQGKLPATDPAHEVSLAPALHGASTEHSDLSWRFFVDHYEHPPTGQDPKHHTGNRPDGEDTGIFYPRAAAVGGCTIHNAMITIAGPDSHWDELADFLGDESWHAARMRPYFQRLECNEYLDRPTPIPKYWPKRLWHDLVWLFGYDPYYSGGRHGFDGWLHTSVADVSIGIGDKQLLKLLRAAVRQSYRDGLLDFWVWLRTLATGGLVRRLLNGRSDPLLDPNHSTRQANSPEGIVLIPLAVCGKRTTVHQDRSNPYVQRGRRSSPRELLLATQASHPNNLEIWSECLVTEVLFNEEKPSRAIGVKLLRGKNLYHAHENVNPEGGVPDEVFVKSGGEVILCGGAFNTPQLLMLSGIGEKKHLEEHGITCRVNLPGVGRNLQDRYEVTVISKIKKGFSVLEGGTFALPVADADPLLKKWREHGTGLYTSNGGVLGIFKRSRPDLNQPDLFIFGVPFPFEGYKVGYSKVGDKHDFFTWTILKANTQNHDGAVRLRGANPRATPKINFHYFNEASRTDQGAGDPDLLAVVEGFKFARGIATHTWAIKGEVHPGTIDVPEGDEERMKDWIRRVAWGHHACGTCRMGPDGDDNAVLDSRFCVRDVKGLRVVDASIFPKIPGYFIVTNIYMASEKAADVILEDAAPPAKTQPEYPSELFAKEIEALKKRREQTPLDPEKPNAPMPVPCKDGVWADDVAGLALSGGGIRSATFNLGVLQALSKLNCLRRFDFLSTVSGGGYIGSFLGRLFDRKREVPFSGAVCRSAADQVEETLANPGSNEISWLRHHGNYAAPTGDNDTRVNVAIYIRNFLTVHFVVGLLLFAMFGLANAIRYGIFDPATGGLGLIVMDKSQMPIGYLLAALFGPFFSPWFVVVEFLLLFLVLPKIAGYWLVSHKEHERYHGPALIILLLAAAALFYLGVRERLAWEPLFLSFSLLSTFFHVEISWRRGRLRAWAIGNGGEETHKLRVPNYLTYDLGLALTITGAALGFAFIDTIGHGLQQWIVEANVAYATAFASIGAALVGLMPIVRFAAGFFLEDKPKSGPPSTITRILKREIVAGLLALVLFTLPLVFYSFAAHAAYLGGGALIPGILVTLMAILFSLVLVTPLSLAFVNRSSLAQAYAARLARAYLGASNPKRHSPEFANITEVVAGDDVASVVDYCPHEAGGPIHLINVMVNQTVDFTSQRGNRDRQGENLAVSSIAMSIGTKWHSSWGDLAETDSGESTKSLARLDPIGRVPGTEHPLVDEAGNPTEGAETLSLRQWMSISGAAIGSGRGAATALGTSLLFGLANVRTGFWWNSGILEPARGGFPDLSFSRRLLYLLPKVFYNQSLILYEWVGRFAGPWAQHWFLSDGGFFENMGGYELIRRRVPRIVICDASADPSYQFEGMAELARKVRIDFNADIEPFTPADLAAHVPASLKELIGSLDELKPPMDASGVASGPAAKRAAIFWVKYQSDPARKSVLLYVKATVPGEEDADVKNYRAVHPEFPHEATADQFFDEAQWESYRRLGEILATPLFTDKRWFWAISLV